MAIKVKGWYCVSLIGGDTVYEYMRGLHQQFFKEPDFPELRQEINEIHQALTEGKAKQERRSLLKLVDLEAELRDETALASFAAGRYRPHRHTDICRPAKGGSANPQCGHKLSCSVH